MVVVNQALAITRGHLQVHSCGVAELYGGRPIDLHIATVVLSSQVIAQQDCDLSVAGKYPDGARRCGLAQKPVRPFACQSSTLVLAAAFART